jgi:DnaJ-class molecular chaperone
VNVEVPKRLTDEQKSLLEKFAATLGETGEGRGKRSVFNRSSGKK